MLMAVNADATVHRHEKIDGAMVELEPLNFPEFVAPVDLVETLVHSIAYGIQTAREIGNPAEAVFEQGERDPKIHEQSFQAEAAPLDPSYVRYSESVRYKSVFEPFRRRLLQKSYADKAAQVEMGAISSGFFGYDDASHNLRHFLGGSGDAIDDLSVDKMIDELPLFRADIIQNVRDSLVKKIANGELEPVDKSEDSTTYAFPTEWRFVGSEGKAEADVYGFREEALDTGNDAADMLFANPPEGVEQAVYDWHIALGKFYYSVRVNVKVDNATQDAELVMQIEVQDHYAWYKNEDVGDMNHQMADLELAGHGRNFPIPGESSVKRSSFNFQDLDTEQGEQLFDWPEEG